MRMNDLGKYKNIGILLIIFIFILIILLHPEYKLDIMNSSPNTCEGMADGESECDLDDTRDKINKLYDMSKKYKKNTPKQLGNTIKDGPYKAFVYRDEHYDSDNGWDNDESEKLKEICKRFKDNTLVHNYFKEYNEILGGESGSNTGLF